MMQNVIKISHEALVEHIELLESVADDFEQHKFPGTIITTGSFNAKTFAVLIDNYSERFFLTIDKTH